jgi:hypothetical protein
MNTKGEFILATRSRGNLFYPHKGAKEPKMNTFSGYGLVAAGRTIPQLVAELEELLPQLGDAAAAATREEHRIKALFEEEGIDPSAQVDLGGALVPPLGELSRRKAAAVRQELRVAKAALVLARWGLDAWRVLLLAERLGVGGLADSTGEGTFTLLPGAPGKQSGGHGAHRAAYLEAARILWGEHAPAEPTGDGADTAAALVLYLQEYEDAREYQAACSDRHLAVAIRILAAAGREDDLRVALRVWKIREAALPAAVA